MYRLILLMAMIACAQTGNNPESLARKNVEAKILPTMDDPDSYEFVSMTNTDTVTYGDVLEWQQRPNESTDMYKRMLKSDIEFQRLRCRPE